MHSDIEAPHYYDDENIDTAHFLLDDDNDNDDGESTWDDEFDHDVIIESEVVAADTNIATAAARSTEQASRPKRRLYFAIVICVLC
jgi:hypothetical protein